MTIEIHDREDGTHAMVHCNKCGTSKWIQPGSWKRGKGANDQINERVKQEGWEVYNIPLNPWFAHHCPSCKVPDDLRKTPPVMSLRDWFAGMALSSMIASKRRRNDAAFKSDDEHTAWDLLAFWSYEQADAMLRQRNKDNPDA